MEHRYFIEGEYYKKDYIPKIYIDKQYFSLKENNFYRCEISGLSMFNNLWYIFFPKGYKISENKNIENENGKYLFNAINKYRNNIQLHEEEKDWLGEKEGMVENRAVYEWIINDYRKNGLYLETIEKKEINGYGKIDWNRTIKNKLPIIQNEQYIYTELITKNNSMQFDDYIRKIHNNILYDCLKKMSWLYDLDIDIEKYPLNIDLEQQIVILEKKLNLIFKEREIQLIQCLLTILKGKINGNESYELVTPYFYFIWEDMLKETFGHNNKIAKNIPKPYWEINHEKKYSRQIPDILIKKNKDLIIIDAKYYSIQNRNEKKYPGWESIVKQLFYYLSLKDDYQEITNLFFMPEVLGTNYEFIGSTSVEGQEKKFGYIYAYTIDLILIIKSYCNNKSKLEILNSILSKLKK